MMPKNASSVINACDIDKKKPLKKLLLKAKRRGVLREVDGYFASD